MPAALASRREGKPAEGEAAGKAFLSASSHTKGAEEPVKEEVRRSVRFPPIGVVSFSAEGKRTLGENHQGCPLKENSESLSYDELLRPRNFLDKIEMKRVLAIIVIALARF